MKGTKRRLRWLPASIVAFGLVAAACGGDDSDTASTTTADGSSGTSAESSDDGAASEEISGKINISGSSTVEPISQRVKELFNEEQPKVEITVAGPGTGDGFKVFCEGETDISDASRPIKDEEAAACEEAGIDYVELKIAYDGITVVTSPSNDAVSCLNFEDLYALIGPESEGLENWSDAQPLATELGSSTELPDQSLSITAPGAESGTYDSFIEIVLEGIGETRAEEGKISEDQAATTRKDYNPSADDNVIIQNIEGTQGSLGWVGFAFAIEQGDKIKEIEVDGGDGCVAPSVETIADGSYGISRPLFIYVNTAKAADNPAVAAYVDYYLGDGYSAVSEVGYVELPEGELADTQSAWESR